MNIKSLYRSTPQSLAEHLSDSAFTLRPFQEYISRRITTGILKGGGRFIISVPPQHGKSELCSHWIPVWFLENFPDRFVISCSYETGNAAKWGRKVRNTIATHPSGLSVRMAADSKARSRWNTNKEGGMLCAGAGSALTGNPGHLIIIDDPHKDWADAMSDTKRESVIDWFNTVAYTRRQPGTTIIVIQTRWHESDLAGWLLANHDDSWEEIRLPAIAEEKDPLGREVGELLCPELFTVDEMNRTKNSLGSFMFNALYQQRPGAADGNIFKRIWWQRYTQEAKPLAFDRIIHSWDTAFEKKKTSAYSACTTWGANQGNYYLLGMWRDRVEYTELRQKMRDLHIQDRPSAIILEDKATGKPLRQELRQIGLPIIPVEPGSDKITRAWSVTPIFEEGRIFIPAGISWADDLIDGLAKYPTGDYTDVVDTISQALAWLSFSKAVTADDIMSKPKTPGIGSCFRFGHSSHSKPVWYRPR